MNMGALLNKRFLILFISINLVLISLANANVYNLCLTKGQTVRFSLCNPSISDRYCSKTLCQYCVSENNGIYCPLSLSYCDSSGECVYLKEEIPKISLNLIEPEDNYETNQNTITFSYKVTNSSYTKNCSLYINNVLVASNSSKITSTTNKIYYSLNPGNYKWYINCTDKYLNSSVSEERSLTIESTTSPSSPTPTITLLNPVNNSILNEGVVYFTYTISNITDIYQCNFVLNNTSIKTITANELVTNENNISLELSNGSYEWGLDCLDNSLRSFQSEKRNLKITNNVQNTPQPSNGGGGGGGGGGGTSSSSGGITFCKTKWECTEWSECINNSQTRNCSYDTKKCKPSESKPIEARSCEPETTNENQIQPPSEEETKETKSSFKNIITGAAVALKNPVNLVSIIIFLTAASVATYFLLKKNKTPSEEKIKTKNSNKTQTKLLFL